MKNRLVLVASLALLLSSPSSFATHQGAWHGDNRNQSESAADHANVLDLIMERLQQLFGE